MADCLLPRTFISIDPIHPQIGINVINELVSDLHRHEEHIGENRSNILGSTSDDISFQLITSVNGKFALITTLSQIRTNLLVLIGAEIGGNKWCDEDELPYSGPKTINNNFDSHWLWPQIIDEIRTVLQNLLCICATVPEGQELWFTLVPVSSTEHSSTIAKSIKSSPVDGNEEDIDEFAWSKFINNPDISIKSHIFGDLDVHESFFSVSDIGSRTISFTVQENNPTPPNYHWGLDATNLEDVNGSGLVILPQIGDIIVGIHAIWIRPSVSSLDLNTSGPGLDWSFNNVPFSIEINSIEIWSGILNHPVEASVMNPFNPPIGDLPPLDLFGQHGVEIKTDRVNIIRPPEVRNHQKKIGLDYRIGRTLEKLGLLTVKVIRPAR